MKFAIGAPGLSRYQIMADSWADRLAPGDMQRICRRFESIGFDSIDAPEHLALDARLVADMGARWPHAIAAMAFFAGATERMLVNSSVIVLPLHHPIALAKALATLDMLTCGRTMVSVGLDMARRSSGARRGLSRAGAHR